MNNDPITDKLNILCGAASKVVMDVFNATPPVFRPVALAALRLSVESCLAAMSESDRAIYVQALGSMELVTIKKERRTP